MQSVKREGSHVGEQSVKREGNRVVFYFFCFIILYLFFFNVMLTWKNMEASKASVLYIYIYI